MIKGFHHPGVVVSDLDRAQDFYCEVLGFEFVLEFSWDESSDAVNQVIGVHRSAATARLLRCQNCYLELFEFSEPPNATENRRFDAHDLGIRHLCFEVDDAIAEFEKLKRYDVSLIMNDPVSFDSGGSAVYCRDPFGNIIEFTTAGRGFPSLEQLQDSIETPDEFDVD